MSAEIWAIGGGKGGTGKTFLTSSLAIYLAGLGKKVTLIDADLGGANLHSVLKITKPVHSLTDFFEKKVTLNDIIEDTPIPNLRLVAGDIRSLNPGTVKYAQRLKLYRHIKTISGEYVLIDLGAGSALNTLDTFLLADKMITVTLPEITSIENLYLFLKKILFRKLNNFLGDHHLRNAAKDAWKNRKNSNIKTIKHLIEHFRSISEEVDTVIDKEFTHFKVNVILNQVRHNPHLQLGASIKSVIIKYFGTEALLSGFINYNDCFWKYLDYSKPILLNPDAKAMYDEIKIIADNIIRGEQVRFSEVAYRRNV
ncbi:MAG: MinD/ParA family protein [bacterium]|nr:MinD/ParA family protein [bacterium]